MTPQIEQHLMANGNLTKRKIMVNNFLGGLSWGFGTVVGATLVVAIVIWVLRMVGILPALNSILNTQDQVKGIHTQLQR